MYRSRSLKVFFLLSCLGCLAVLPALVLAEDSIINSYKNAIAVDPKDVIAHFNLGLAYYKLEQFDEARKILEKCLNLNRADKASHKQVDGTTNQLLGIIYYSHVKNDRKAITAFRRSLRQLPGDADTFYAMGLAYLRLKEYQNSIQAFQKAVSSGRTKDAEVYYHIGRAYFAVKKKQETILNYEKALEINPEFQVVLEALGVIYHQEKREDEAIKVLKRLVKLDAMNFNANYLLGLNYYRKKMYSEMVTAYNRAVAVKPDLADAHYNLGMAYYYQTRYDMAIAALKKAVTLNPKDSEAFNLLGQAQTASVEMHMQKAGLLIAKEQYNHAIAEFQKVLEIDKTNHKAKALLDDTERKLKEEFAAHLSLADKFYADKRLEDAYNEYEHALRLGPGSQRARVGMKKARVQISKLLAGKLRSGKAAEKIGDYESARERYESALKLKPGYAPAKQALNALKTKLTAKMQSLYRAAKKYTAENKMKRAAKHYRSIKKMSLVFRNAAWEEKALSGLTRVNSKKANLIRKYLAQGKKAYQAKAIAQAKIVFSQVLALDPRNRTANDYIVKLTGSQSEVKVAAEKVRKMYYQGVDLYVKGKIKEAIQAWQEVRVLDPNNEDATINIKRAKAKLLAIRKLTEGK